MMRVLDVVPPTKVEGSMWLYQVDVAKVVCLTLAFLVVLVAILVAVVERRRSWRDYQLRKRTQHTTVGQCSCQGHEPQSPWVAGHEHRPG